MREIKFRGKDIDNRLGWHYGYFFKDGNRVYISENGRSQEVDPKTVGEFTGLYDQDKKEIYEGDIVETEYGVSVIKYQIGAFLPFQIIEGEDIFDCWHWSYCLVVGNIYENPELLKKGGEE